MKNIYKEIVEFSAEGFIYQEADGQIKVWNDEAARIFGLGEEDTVGQTSTSREWYLINEDGTPCPGEEHPSMITLTTGQALTNQVRGIRKADDSITWISINTRPLFTSGEDKPGAVIISFTDITAKKQTEADLRFQSSITEQMSEGVIVTNPEGRIVYVNQANSDLYGYGPKELIGRDPGFLNAEPIADEIQDDIFRTVAKGGVWRGVNLNRKKDGTLFHCELRISPILDAAGHPSHYLALARDITNRVRSERTLRDSETRFREIFNNMTNGVAIYEPVDEGTDFVFKDLNRAGLEYGRKSREEVIGQRVTEVFPGIGELGLLDVFKRVNRTGRPEHHPSSVYLDDELTMWVENYVCKLPTGDLVAIYEDTTARKKAEAALAASEERLQLALDSVSDAVWDWRVDVGEVYFSSRWYTMLGYEPYELDQAFETWRSLLHPQDLPGSEEAVFKHLESGEPFEIECRMRTKDGGWRWILSRGRVVARDAEGRPVRMLGTHVDITERKRLEAQLVQSQKMDALGTLSSGIAHDFNNILAAILGYAELAMDDLPPDGPVRQDLESIIKAAIRARNLVRQILTFSRVVQGNKQPVSVNRVVEESLGLLGRVLPKMINLDLDLQEGAWPVMADAQQLEQVLINLATNSADAVGDKGRITISTANLVLGKQVCDTCGEIMSGRYLAISFADDGAGMSPETRAKVFEPFFTTKSVGKGTGLGLSTVYGIVTGHEGHINCRSAPDLGTEFVIYLPALAEDEADTGPDQADERADLSGSGTILVVDDEPAVRDIARKILTRNGYRVILAGSGEEALALFRNERGSIELVVLDLGMPGMGGKACLEEIRRLDPEAKVIIASGYIQYEVTDELTELGAAGMVSKPYSMTDLLKSVREVLDR